MGGDEKTDETSLTLPLAHQLSDACASLGKGGLVRRGLQELKTIPPATIQWESATLRGVCYKARKHYGPKEFPGTRRFYFVCRIENATDEQQAPTSLQIFLRSVTSAILSPVPDATLIMLYRNEQKYRSVDLGPRDWTLAKLEFGRTFPISRPTKECQDELLGDTSEIIASDPEGKITVVLKVS
jgi:hypothetical protein